MVITGLGWRHTQTIQKEARSARVGMGILPRHDLSLMLRTPRNDNRGGVARSGGVHPRLGRGQVRIYKRRHVVRGFSLALHDPEGSHYSGGGEALGLPRFARGDNEERNGRFIFACLRSSGLCR